MNSIFTRRSVRQFSDKKIEDSKLDKIIRAGMQAPSAGNQQPWEFLVIRNKEKIEKLSTYHQYAACLKGVDVAIIVLGNTLSFKNPDYWEQDLGAATQNIQLMATELELGSVWLGTAPKKDRMDFIRNMFDLSDNLLPYSVIGVGYPKNENANHFIDRYDEKKVKYID